MFTSEFLQLRINLSNIFGTAHAIYKWWMKSHVIRSPSQLLNSKLLVYVICRLDNLIYNESTLQVDAVLDWELSTIGDPLTDLAGNCMPYYLPEGVGGKQFVGELTHWPLGDLTTISN